MIQELLGGAGLRLGENKISINGGVLASTPSLSLPSSSCPSSTTSNSTNSSASTAAPVANTTSSNSENQNLKCPRCNSSNTKFCYCNNYNLSQSYHFCKTCRQYWTKGGTLRNIPIGGGYRKNKNISMSNSMVKASAAKMRTIPYEFGRPNFVGVGFNHVIAT